MRTSSSTFVSFWNQHVYNRCPGYQTMSNVMTKLNIITTNEILNCLLCNRSVKLIIKKLINMFAFLSQNNTLHTIQ